MPDEVIPEGDQLADGETMFVYERTVVLSNGATVVLRRFYFPAGDGKRRYLADGRWCAVLGGVDRVFAVPGGIKGGHEWRYGGPYGFETWQDALGAARECERLEVAA